jgi:hypothetical protein
MRTVRTFSALLLAVLNALLVWALSATWDERTRYGFLIFLLSFWGNLILFEVTAKREA